jgi:hypothetical protein
MSDELLEMLDEQLLSVANMWPPVIFPLGSKVRDTVTGYVGKVTARSLYLNSDDEYLVEAQNLQTGDIIEHWFVVGRLEGAPITVQIPEAEGFGEAGEMK